MSSPVDVMGVLNYAAEILGQHGWNTSANAVDDVRAAVAELIEAATPHTQGTNWLTGEQHERLRAALARCNGGAA